MLLIYFTIPNSSFIGHFCGLFAGLIIKFGGAYLIFPEYSWIKAFDEKFENILSSLKYFKVTPDITTDFDAYFFRTIWDKMKQNFLKMRHKLFGYSYLPP